jgi:hypothetical protein
VSPSPSGTGVGIQKHPGQSAKIVAFDPTFAARFTTYVAKRKKLLSKYNSFNQKRVSRIDRNMARVIGPPR